VHVEVGGLDPDRVYWYRFRAGGVESPIGRTRTAPAASATRQALRFAFASCQNYTQGYYTAHAAIGFDGADFLTSPELGPAFGRALARAAIDCWSGIGKPSSWDLVEAGAGRRGRNACEQRREVLLG